MTAEPEHLISLRLKDGSAIDFLRMEDRAVHVCHGDDLVILPRASGKLTLDMVALLELFGEIEGD